MQLKDFVSYSLLKTRSLAERDLRGQEDVRVVYPHFGRFVDNPDTTLYCLLVERSLEETVKGTIYFEVTNDVVFVSYFHNLSFKIIIVNIVIILKIILIF